MALCVSAEMFAMIGPAVPEGTSLKAPWRRLRQLPVVVERVWPIFPLVVVNISGPNKPRLKQTRLAVMLSFS